MKKLFTVASAFVLAGALVACNKTTATSDTLSEAQKKEVTTLVEQYIWNNPQKVIDSLNNMQRMEEEKRQQAAQNAVKDVLPQIYEATTYPVMGAKDAPYTIVAFFDYGCGYCRRMSHMMMEPVSKNKNIRFIFVETPIFGADSEYAARMAMAADTKGKFKEFHEALMDSADLSAASVEGIAKDLGLDVAELKKVADSQEYKDRIAANMELAQKMGLSGVPMFILDGEVYPGAFSEEKLDLVLKAADAKAAK